MVNSMGVSSKSTQEEGPRRRGRLSHKGCWRSHTQNLYLHVVLQAVLQGMGLHEEAVVSLRTPQATWSNKMDPEVALPWRSSAELSTVMFPWS